MAQGTGMTHASRNRRGFTLIELLVVIGIIGILVGITFAVGRSVVGGSKKNATEDTMRVLDTALQAYIQARGENPPFTVRFTNTTTNVSNTLVALDGTFDDGDYIINSVGVFVAVAQQVPEAKAVLDKLGPKQIVQLDADGAGPQPTLPTVLDAWGRPIRFVHPKGDGLILGDLNSTGNSREASRRLEAWMPLASGDPAYLFDAVRRNHSIPDVERTADGVPIAGDSDGGKTAGSRPYFYSAGEDGLVGYSQVDGAWVNYNTDNVYLSEPTFSKPPQ